MHTGSARCFLIACAVAVAGCSTTASDLKGAKGRAFSTTISVEPAAAYRRIVQKTRECFDDAGIRIDADYFPDTRQGDISITLVAAKITMAVANLQPFEGNGTRLDVHYFETWTDGGDGHRWLAESMRSWASGERGRCIK